jgi:hypothetical protein
MKYRDLIQFEPVESIIKLRQADDHQKAEQLVSTYVISERMADVLQHRILPCLDLENVGAGRGLFVVGNYGTGKSHLMSVVSAVVEHTDLLEKLTHAAVAEGLTPIAGKYKVVRQEFGSTSMSLRDVVVQYLEKGLANMGVAFHFPAMDEAPNAKDSLIQMMHVFSQHYPDHGLLVVIDELLEFLGARTARELVLDLSFLREVGEICEQTHLRFIAGLQESLFDSPRFQFAADSIRRVKDRFDQVRIVREDVAYVVSRRLLAKTQAQRALVRAHLEQFTPLYDSMAEKLEEFVELFPVHPAYLEMFEQVTVIEKRQVLQALSQEMRARLDLDVPEDQPGITSFDSYWELIKADASYRSVPEIRDVMEKSRVIEDRLKNALAVPAYKPAAARILNALALHRLSVSDLRAPVGLTSKELRDRLCLSIPIPEKDGGFLLTSIESVLSEISKTMSGQFISHNRDNGQYYLDLDKDIDFDALVEQRADTLDDDVFDRYYFDMLARALELTDSTYVPGFPIWQRDMPWLEQGITRQGYVFLGAPNERSTAQPPRDFYLHFLALYSTNGGQTEGLADEVFFSLSQRDAEFDQALRLYAGAREMASISSGEYREQYERKADRYLREMAAWLSENFMRAFEIRYRTETLTPAEVLTRFRLSPGNASLRDQVFRMASACLRDQFQNTYPDYPRFSLVSFTTETIPQGADAALRAIAGRQVTRPAQSVLEALQVAMVEENRLIFTLDQSPYARDVLKQLNGLPAGKVLNRSALVKGGFGVEKDIHLGLEIEWLVVVLVALVRQGEVSLNMGGRKIDSDDLEDAAQLGVGEISKFTSISRPRSLPEQALRALFEGLDLPEGWIVDSTKHEFAVRELNRKVEEELNLAVRALEWLREGLHYWGEPLLSPDEQQAWRDQLTGYKDFLDSLQHLTTPGRLRNFSHGIGEVRQSLRARELLAHVRDLNETLQALQPHLAYIYQAEILLSKETPWLEEARQVRGEHLQILGDPEQRRAATVRARLNGGLANLRSSYAQAYIKMHNRARLNTTQDTRKKRLVQDTRWVKLKALAAALDLLPAKKLEDLEKAVEGLYSCHGVGASDLKNQPKCPLCGFDLSAEDNNIAAFQRLEAAEAEFEELYQGWIATLCENLRDASMQENIHMLADKDRTGIEQFLQSGDLPEKISYQFLDALRDALHGLEKVTLDGGDFLLALTKPGMPCTPGEFEDRFRKLLIEQITGKDPKKVRIQIDW